MKTRLLTLSLISFLVVLFSMFHYSNNGKIVIVESDMNDSNYWFSEAIGYGSNITFANGIAYLTVNDTDGIANNFWDYAKLQKGILPHGWSRKDMLPEITFRRYVEAEKGYIFLKIIAKRSEPKFYSHNDSHDPRSISNINVALIFQLDDKYDLGIDQSNQLVVDIRLSPYVKEGDNVRLVYEDWSFQGEGYPDFEYYYQANAKNIMLESNKWYEINEDVGEIIKKAFEKWNIQQAKLKCVLFYCEGYYSSVSVQFDYVKLYVDPQMESKYVLVQSFTFGLISLVLCSLILILLKRII
jgi:hypothetical protein